MYHGKFDAKAKGQSAPGETLENILKERDEAIARKAAKKAAKAAPAPTPAPTKAPAKKAAKAPAEKKAKPEVVAENQKAQAPKKTGPRMGGVIFYTLYFLFIFVFFVGVFVGLNWDNDGMMAVTPFIDDEKPLFVETDEQNSIKAFLDEHADGVKYVSGGVYALNEKAVRVLEECMANGMSRMRNFQRGLIAAGLKLKAYPIEKIVDVDHANDIETAERFISE